MIRSTSGCMPSCEVSWGFQCLKLISLNCFWLTVNLITITSPKTKPTNVIPDRDERVFLLKDLKLFIDMHMDDLYKKIIVVMKKCKP